jgi:hypothetical protein
MHYRRRCTVRQSINKYVGNVGRGDNTSNDGKVPEGISALGSTTQGASLFLTGKVVSKLIMFLTNILLTRFLGVTPYGMYAYMGIVFSLVQRATRLGGDKSALRYLPEYQDEPRTQNAILSVAYGTAIVMSVVDANHRYYN